MLKRKDFWVGVAIGVVLLSFFPQLNPRAFLAKPKAA